MSPAHMIVMLVLLVVVVVVVAACLYWLIRLGVRHGTRDARRDIDRRPDA